KREAHEFAASLNARPVIKLVAHGAPPVRGLDDRRSGDQGHRRSSLISFGPASESYFQCAASNRAALRISLHYGRSSHPRSPLVADRRRRRGRTGEFLQADLGGN